VANDGPDAVQQPEAAPRITPPAPQVPVTSRTDGRVTLAPVPPLESLTLPPLEEGGKEYVIPAAGVEVDADTALRAQEAATCAGFRLQEL
jgi:hypothetical protein